MKNTFQTPAPLAPFRLTRSMCIEVRAVRGRPTGIALHAPPPPHA